VVIYSYAIGNPKQASPGPAKAVRQFLTWALTQGNSPTYLDRVHFLPLPRAIVKLSEAQIATVR
jgi:phosphate transport system substrate-binding protein